MAETVTIRQVYEVDITEQLSQQLVDVLRESFRENTLIDAITSMKEAARDPFHRMCVLAGLDAGETYIAESPSGKVVGVAIWLSPGRSFLDTKELLDKAHAPFVNALEPADAEYWTGTYLPGYTRHTNECFEEMGASKEAMWTLITLGILPEYRGQGIARSLLEPVERKAAQDGALRCLETTSETNVQIYSRLGWELKGHYSFPKGDITIEAWVMLGKEHLGYKRSRVP